MRMGALQISHRGLPKLGILPLAGAHDRDGVAFKVEHLARRERAARHAGWRGPGDELPGLHATVHLTPQVSQGHLPHRQFQGIAEQLPLVHDGLSLKASALGVGHGHARRHARDVRFET